jgi:hypothetical protein
MNEFGKCILRTARRAGERKWASGKKESVEGFEEVECMGLGPAGPVVFTVDKPPEWK